MSVNLAPFIWHQDFCPAPAHEGDCCCGYAEAKALAEEIDTNRGATAAEIDLDAIAQRWKEAGDMPWSGEDVPVLVACCRKLLAEQSEMRLKINMLDAKDAKTEITRKGDPV